MEQCKNCKYYRPGWCSLWDMHTKPNDECDNFEEDEEDDSNS